MGYNGKDYKQQIPKKKIQFSSTRFKAQLGSVCSSLFGSTRFSSTRFNSVWFNSVRFDSVQLSLVQFGLFRLGSTRFDLTQFKSVGRFGSNRSDSV